MDNETESTHITAVENIRQVIQDLGDMLEKEGTQAMQDKCSILKKHFELHDGTLPGSPRPRKQVIKLQLEVSDETEPSSNGLFLGTLPGSSHR